MLLGQADAGPLNLDDARRRWSSTMRAAVLQSLQDVGFESLADLLSTYAGHATDLEPWLEGAEINRDRNLRLQYLAGLELNQYLGGRIYAEMVSFRRPLGDRVIAAPELRDEILRGQSLGY